MIVEYRVLVRPADGIGVEVHPASTVGHATALHRQAPGSRIEQRLVEPWRDVTELLTPEDAR
ncbi:hypothetical protein [Actinoalloteichus sp. GBA129-24]|uniref:hypothetical protein n=1 Tax=Actinoalloteichus sp. GBA129-24 TaxID=1612551 RepID=UPI0009504784|nr:hypothetical protein [Actinoalloteichus sp. GBA129-24]APU20910.1 hypothetical protein UA75_14500 [Actinoalloteichus sp. GBA129-24]APU24159.1 hypothetical protein UA75_30980 [Actinoalloteichus sp. GBA129-24]